MRRFVVATAVGVLFVALAAGPAAACGGLIGPNGSVNLVRTTTLAAYHDGIEHYLTAFKFAGVGGEFGSIVPLPGVPTAVERGGDWTLQRLVKEVTPPPKASRTLELAATAGVADSAQILLETRIDALDITVLKGGARAVGEWATDHGFLLTPDTPEVLDFYARRSPIFLAARFDADAARQRGVALGDGTPVHVTIPTSNPWVPLRILALGRQPAERVNADVFLLTDRRPALLPGDNAPGMDLTRSQTASTRLLDDLRSDQGMGWVPNQAWLTYLKVDAAPSDLTYDLAVDASGAGRPSPEATGLPASALVDDGAGSSAWAIALGAGLGIAVLLGGLAYLGSARDPRARSSSRVIRFVAAAAVVAGVLAACSGDGGVRTVVLDVHHSAFSESAITVRRGESVRFVIRNRDPIPHELIVGDEAVQAVHERGTEAHHAARPGEVSVAANATAETTYTFTATSSGPLMFGCHLPGHWAYGMRGTIRVV